MNLNPINIITTLIIISCVGVIAYFGYSSYNYYNDTSNLSKNVYLIAKDDKQSVSTSYALTIKNVNVNIDEKTDIVEIVNNQGSSLLSVKRADLNGSTEINKFCPSLRLEVFSDKPTKINMTGIGCK